MPDEMANKTIFIAGPTASGKTALAVDLARRIGAEIINADSMQVYADLPILSAQPDAAEQQAAPHHLFGHVDGEVRYSVGGWLEDVKNVLSDIGSRKRSAIIVGGTGLYFAGLENGLAPMPTVPDAVLGAAQALLDDIGLEAFREKIIEKDPVLARLEANDTQRHLRAWTVMEVSGVRFSDLQKASGDPFRPDAKVVILPEREALYAACERRFDDMLEGGALEEARQLAARELSADLPVMRAVGAAELISHLEGVLSLDEAAELAKRNTRHLAKRQMTWFRNQARAWQVAETRQDALNMILRDISH